MSAPFPAPVSPGVTSPGCRRQMGTWTISLLSWQIKDDQAGYELLGDSLAVSTELASRLLLVAV